jgi:hypothetical protein
MEPNTELLPFVPIELLPPAPPLPTVTVYEVPVVIETADSADAPPPEFSPVTLERYPPAPPPQAVLPPPPPPAITKYSTDGGGITPLALLKSLFFAVPFKPKLLAVANAIMTPLK